MGMNRGQKKFLYGLFYLAIIGIVMWIFWPSTGAVPPPCSGLSCGTNQPLPLQIGATQIFKSETARKIILLSSVKNPNSEYGVNYFSYEFSISGRSGESIAKISGAGKIHPSETRYVLESYDAAGLDLRTVAEKGDLKIGNAVFRPAAEFSKLLLILVSEPVTDAGSDRITVSGAVKNQGASPIGGVRVTALLENQYGDPVFASETVIGGVDGFGESPFSIHFPPDQTLIDSIDVRKTEVFFNPE